MDTNSLALELAEHIIANEPSYDVDCTASMKTITLPLAKALRDSLADCEALRAAIYSRGAAVLNLTAELDQLDALCEHEQELCLMQLARAERAEKEVKMLKSNALDKDARIAELESILDECKWQLGMEFYARGAPSPGKLLKRVEAALAPRSADVKGE